MSQLSFSFCQNIYDDTLRFVSFDTTSLHSITDILLTENFHWVWPYMSSGQ